MGYLRPKTQGEEMVTTKYELDALMVHFRGRIPDAAEEARYIGKVSYRELIPSLQSGPEHDRLMQAISYGDIALRDNWPGQIATLKAQLDDAQRKVDALVAKPTKVGLLDLQDQISQTTLKAGETLRIIEPEQTQKPIEPSKPSMLTKLLSLFVKPNGQA